MNLPVLVVVVSITVVTTFIDEISHSRREFKYENAETDCLLI